MATLFVHGKSFTKELQDTLGILGPIRSITIDSSCNAAVSVTVEFVLSVDQLAEVKSLLRKYRVVDTTDNKALEMLRYQDVTVQDGILYVNGIAVGTAPRS